MNMQTPGGHTNAITASRVIGTAVYNTAGDRIGSIEDVMLEKMSNGIMFAVIGFGGFLVIVEGRPRQGVVLLADAKETTETDDSEHDTIGGLFQHHVLDVADVFAGGVVDVGADHPAGRDRFGMACYSGHRHLLR